MMSTAEAPAQAGEDVRLFARKNKGTSFTDVRRCRGRAAWRHSAAMLGSAIVVAALLLAPTAAQAQFICAGSPNGSAPVSGFGATAGANSMACGAIGTTAADGGTGSSNSVAVGLNVTAAGSSSANNAFGTGANASGNSASNSAFGPSSNASGDGGGNSAFGLGANASGAAGLNTAIGELANASGAGSANIAIGVAANASGGNAENIAIGQSAQANGGTAIAIGLSANAASNSVAIGNGSVANVANTFSIGSSTNQRTLVNVAAGSIASGSTDGVNGGQLFTANQRVANAFGGGAGLDGNGQLTAPTYTIAGTNYDNVGSALAAVNTQLTGALGFGTYVKVNSTAPAASASGANAIAIGGNAQATQSGGIAMGFNAASTGPNAIAIGTNAVATGSVAVGGGAVASNGGAAYGDNAVATGANSAAVGAGATATAPNSVAIGAGAVASAPNTVSFGAPGAERRLTNVAAGIAPTDAVNMSQLGSVNSGLQSQITNARAGVAMAVAMGGGFLPDNKKFAVATNVGTYAGQNAVALTGLVRLSNNLVLTGSAGYGVGADADRFAGRGGIQMAW